MALETDGERKYFEAVYKENYLKMYHVALGMLKHPADAENAVHEAFLAIADRFEKYCHLKGREMAGFCVSVVRNKAIDSIRKTKHYSETELEELVLWDEREAVNPELVLEKNEEQKRVRKSLGCLPEVYRETLILKYYYELANREIAKIQNVSVKTVEMRLYRGKLKLREVMYETEAE